MTSSSLGTNLLSRRLQGAGPKWRRRRHDHHSRAWPHLAGMQHAVFQHADTLLGHRSSQLTADEHARQQPPLQRCRSRSRQPRHRSSHSQAMEQAGAATSSCATPPSCRAPAQPPLKCRCVGRRVDVACRQAVAWQDCRLQRCRPNADSTLSARSAPAVQDRGGPLSLDAYMRLPVEQVWPGGATSAAGCSLCPARLRGTGSCTLHLQNRSMLGAVLFSPCPQYNELDPAMIQSSGRLPTIWPPGRCQLPLLLPPFLFRSTTSWTPA